MTERTKSSKKSSKQNLDGLKEALTVGGKSALDQLEVSRLNCAKYYAEFCMFTQNSWTKMTMFTKRLMKTHMKL